MDPTSTATALAIIVGLICNFRQERGATEQLDHKKFVEWLEYHQHEDIKNLILNTYHLQAEVDKLLREDHDLMLKKLEAISGMLASLMSHISEFRGLAVTLVPSIQLSDQAVSILRQFVKSNSKYMLLIKHTGGCILNLEVGGNVKESEPRFLEDDLNTLVAFGLLTLDYGSSGNPLYRITRNAVKFIEMIDNKAT